MTSSNASSEMQSKKFTGYQKFVVAILAFLQFTIILDFMILSPLGAILMPALNISPKQFGLVVSAYAFSAGSSGLLAAGFADRFDRKKLLLFFYCGFLLGTLLCGIAPSYVFLLCARIVTGLFGGVIGSIVLSIVTDLFVYEMRGRVMGFIQTAFAASQILGIPAGLYLANLWGWHSAFLMIVLAGIVVGIVMILKMQPIDKHLLLKTEKTAFKHFIHTISNPLYATAFLFMALLSTGGFMLMPFGSAFTVHNLGISVELLPKIYLITGIFTIFTGPLVGKASDRFGKTKVFMFGSIISIIMVFIYTRMGVTPLWEVVVVNTVMFVGIFSRMIPSQAFISSIPDPASRGSFMAVSTSLQQISGGIAAVIAGSIVVEASDGQLEHFNILGNVLNVTALLNILLLLYLMKQASDK
jgi:predicted MFS family arabinose efflux permease